MQQAMHITSPTACTFDHLAQVNSSKSITSWFDFLEFGQGQGRQLVDARWATYLQPRQCYALPLLQSRDTAYQRLLLATSTCLSNDFLVEW